MILFSVLDFSKSLKPKIYLKTIILPLTEMLILKVMLPLIMILMMNILMTMTVFHNDDFKVEVDDYYNVG